MKHMIVAIGLILLMSSGLASGYVSQNTQIPNNPITITGCTSPTVEELSLLTIDFGHTDLDSDTGMYATNATHGELNATTGVFTWTPTAADSGVYTWNFNVSDGYGSVDDCDSIITVTDHETIPNIYSPYPATPITTQNYAADIDISAMVDQSANNHWEIDDGTGYSHLEWDNATVTPIWVFSPSTYGIGDYNVTLTAHNITDNDFNQSYTWAIHVEGNWTTHDMVLEPYFTHTVIAKDSLTYATISSFTATFNGIEKSTTSGSIAFDNISYGLYSLEVSATGHYSSTSSVLVVDDSTTTVYLGSTVADSTDPGAGTYYPPHYVEFIVTNSTGVLYEGVTVSATWIDSLGATMQMDDVTGTNGAAVFNMTQNLQYTMTFIHTGHGISETRVLYPIGNLYYIYINESYTYDPGNVSTELTSYSTTNTSRDWAIHNLTSTDLNSTIGLGMLGQGIVASTAIWVIVGAGGPATAFAAIAAMAGLGIVTWILALFCGMTTVALYILGGKIR